MEVIVPVRLLVDAADSETLFAECPACHAVVRAARLGAHQQQHQGGAG